MRDYFCNLEQSDALRSLDQPHVGYEFLSLVVIERVSYDSIRTVYMLYASRLSDSTCAI
jgi:hypothetical protein